MAHPFGIGDLSSLGLPGANPLQAAGLLDTMELVRKAWSSFALPPAMAPTIDPEEIERRVAELKAVEQWLVMNLTMLRGTIQALEIQRSTLAAMQAFGLSGKTAMNAAMGEGWGGAQGAAQRPPAQPASGPAGRWPASAVSEAEARVQAQAAPGPAAQDASPRASETAPADDTGAAAAAASLQPPVNPVAWWDMLQKQFGQVAAAALAGMPGTGTVGNPSSNADAAVPRSSASTSSGTGPLRTGSAGTGRATRAAGSGSAATSEGGSPGASAAATDATRAATPRSSGTTSRRSPGGRKT
jgi:hypothetical protein